MKFTPTLGKIEPNGQVTAIRSSPLVEYEHQLEQWLEDDISLLFEDLLVIGRQVETDAGLKIDLLCMNNVGDLVVCELKRRETSGDIVAQVLAYTRWVRNLPANRIVSLANTYLASRRAGSLKQAFAKRFCLDLPILNRNQKVIIVATALDFRSEQAFQQLAESGQDITVVTFRTYREPAGKQYIVSSVLLAKDLTPPGTEAAPGSKGISDDKLGEYIDRLLGDEREITKELTIDEIVSGVVAEVVRASAVNRERIRQVLAGLKRCPTHMVEFREGDTVRITRTKQYWHENGERRPIPQGAPEKPTSKFLSARGRVNWDAPGEFIDSKIPDSGHKEFDLHKLAGETGLEIAKLRKVMDGLSRCKSHIVAQTGENTFKVTRTVQYYEMYGGKAPARSPRKPSRRR